MVMTNAVSLNFASIDVNNPSFKERKKVDMEKRIANCFESRY